ncbi:MAG TPA: WXG100 family type VII secretion target [Micromonospora sp.]
MATPDRGVVGGEFGLMADEATITGMVVAFAQAQTEARNSHSNVVAATEALTRSWSSDTAAPRFLAAVQQWLVGFQKVQQGLDKLNQSMQQYARLTTTTEDDNAMQAGNWATPAGGEQPLPPRTRWVTGHPGELRSGMVVQKPFAPLGRVEGE